jgi:CRISPR-associated endonuclease Csn1
MIFIEMARGATEDQKKRKNSRLDQIKALYEKIDEEEVRELNDQLESWGDTAHNKLQSDKIFLYFTQLGKCLYSGEKISLESVLA